MSSPAPKEPQPIDHGVHAKSLEVESHRASSRSTADSEKKNQEIGIVLSEGHGQLTDAACDPLFGNEDGAEVKYKTMEWWNCGLLMIAECISLGILSLPHAMAVLGLYPSLALIIGLGVAAGYTGYVIGQFKLAHPECHSMADAGFIILGPWGRELLGFGQVVVLIFIMAAHITSFTIMLNVLSGHSTCSIGFSIIGVIISLVMTLPRTLKKMSYLSIVSCISILTAIVVVMINVGIIKPNPNAVHSIETAKLTTAMNAALNIVLAYSGHVTYFGFASELRDPRDFTKGLIFLQTTAITLYTLTAVVIYYYAGPDVPAPALGAATPTVQKIAYGLASPTIIIAGVVNGHVASKYIYIRVWSSTKSGIKVIQEKSKRAYLSWVAICTAVWIVAWIIAEAIPTFKYLLALVSALFSGWYSYGITGLFWLNINKGKWFANPRKVALTILNVLILCAGCIICGLGLYATGKAIHNGESGQPFSCADNSL